MVGAIWYRSGLRTCQGKSVGKARANLPGRALTLASARVRFARKGAGNSRFSAQRSPGVAGAAARLIHVTRVSEQHPARRWWGLRCVVSSVTPQWVAETAMVLLARWGASGAELGFGPGGDHMRRLIVLGLSLGMAVVSLAAPAAFASTAPAYTLTDVGTFGGPQAALDIPGYPITSQGAVVGTRSEERRVGKECRSRW